MPYRPKRDRGKGLNYQRESGSTHHQRDGDAGIDLSDPRQASEHTWLEFAAGGSWTPQCVELNGRKGRRAACVLAQDRFRYRVYDMDSRGGAAESQDPDSEISE